MDYSIVRIDGYTIRVGIKSGANELTPWLIFNGIGANLELIQSFVKAKAAEKFEIISFDIPGTGQSKTPLLPYRFSSMARLASKVLDAYGYNEVDVLGFSWGGALAQQFAKNYSSRCRHLILAATSTGHFAFPPNPTVWLKMLTPKFYEQGINMVSVSSKTVVSSSFKGFFYQLLASNGWTSVHWLHKIKQPTLILSGENDLIVSLSNGHLMKRLLPNSRLEIFQCGHLFMVSKPELTAQFVSDFVMT